MYKFGTAGPVSTTIATITAGAGQTSFTVTSATGLPTLAAGDFATARIGDGTGSAENIVITAIAGTTITCVATTVIHAAGAAIDFDVLTNVALVGLLDDAIAGTSENALTAAGALLSGTGAVNRITITSAAATFTLANGTYKGELCRVVVDLASTKLATIDPAGSTMIDGVTTLVMWAGESAMFGWNGIAWERRGGVSRPMACSMYLSANQTSVAHNVGVQILLNTTHTDNTGLMANTGANKMTVQRTGKYLVSQSVIFSLPAANVAIPLMQGIVKQGATTVSSGFSSAAANGAGTWAQGQASRIVSLTAGDDITLQAYQNSGNTTGYIFSGVETSHLTLVEQIGG